MFRTLSTRLVATYVFGAFVLVVIVIAAVTAFALSMFGISARAESDALARQVPDEVRLEIARAGSLDRAASDIVRHLARPDFHVVLFDDRGRFLAASHPHLAGPPPGFGEGPRAGRRPERMQPFPFGLDGALRLPPRAVSFPGGSVRIFPDGGPLARMIDAFWLAMLPVGIFVVFSAWLLGRFIAGQALRPLVETTASLNRFGAGDFTPRSIVTSDRSEIGELVAAYNAAVAQVSRAFEERSAAERNMRQFIADAGHELRTPLTVVMGFIDVLRRRESRYDGAGSARIYETMMLESRRMKALIDKLIVLARLDAAHPRELETVDLGDVAARVVTALEALDPAARIAFEREPGSLVRGYENELHDALSNLVENALKYAPQSPVQVSVRDDGATAVVDVVDRGPGIAPRDQPFVFDRFYRGAERGDAEGFGLGLAIAKRAVERAGGRIELVSTPGLGSRFTIRIPRAPGRAEPAVLTAR